MSCLAGTASSGTVVLIGSDGQPRRLTANDLEGTSITLGAIRAMLARRFGARTRIVDDDDDEDEDAEMDDDDEESDGGGDWWGSVLSLVLALAATWAACACSSARVCIECDSSVLTTPRIPAFPFPHADQPAGLGSTSIPSSPNRKKLASDSNEAARSVPCRGNTTTRSAKGGTFRRTTRPTTSAGANSTFVSRGGTCWET